MWCCYIMQRRSVWPVTKHLCNDLVNRLFAVRKLVMVVCEVKLKFYAVPNTYYPQKRLAVLILRIQRLTNGYDENVFGMCLCVLVNKLPELFENLYRSCHRKLRFSHCNFLKFVLRWNGHRWRHAISQPWCRWLAQIRPRTSSIKLVLPPLQA